MKRGDVFKKYSRNLNIFQITVWVCHLKNYYGMNMITSCQSKFKGNMQFIFLCSPQKSSVNVCLMKMLKSTVMNKVIVFFITQVKKAFKSSSFCIISNFHNGFVSNPSKVQRSLFEQIALKHRILLIRCLSNIETYLKTCVA